MKLCTLTHNEMLSRHPKEMDQIFRKLRNSTSKRNQASIFELTWSYETYLKVEPFSSLDEAQAFEAMTLEEHVADELSRSITTLYGRIGHWHDVKKVPNPPELEDYVRGSWIKRIFVKERFQSLSPQERDNELQETLRECMKMPNFVYIRK